MTSDASFTTHVTERLAALPGVAAVALGGSRAQNTHRPDSDWDFSVYYRDGFTPDAVRGLGWPGEVCEFGAWGGGVFNGGARLTVEDRAVDLHYRELADVERRLAHAREGRFEVERLLFHLAGVPTYLVVAELAVNRVLFGELPRPSYPQALRRAGHARWSDDARLTLGYADRAHAGRGHVTDVAGAIGRAACEAAHAVSAGRGEWVTNEKTLLDRAGLRGVDEIAARLTPSTLSTAIAETGALLDAALTASRPD
ncbi:nucleotidyltransferase domain-containing protein [Embleya scabrispora]|uniref:nucleotidyltransferase domain-containing protein n=1 Tax=Embleya scabrispora TaxID=159449 RepID=UPI00037CEF93|nr:nucleotidyltransferase domain-containing protein [Embleya scabrispora]MYS83546.1 nucleotidyltransferase domain-containing protein [Streptomyces sp. SID5474]